jgi:hypothetical protein
MMILQITLRVLDRFFLEGTKILFKVGLAILKLKQEKLLLERDGTSVACFLKEKIAIDENKLLEVKQGLKTSTESTKSPLHFVFIFYIHVFFVCCSSDYNERFWRYFDGKITRKNQCA